MNCLLRFLTAGAAVLVSSQTFAQVWNEQGDAGDLPTSAQVPIGQGALVSIRGTIGGPSDVDMYCIRIDANYQASLCDNGFGADSQLLLFQRVNGRGVAVIDDVCGRAARLGNIQPPSGDYLIAIAGFNRDPINAGGSAIWLDQPFFTERAPDGPGATGSVAAWSGIGDTGAYSIALSGVSYCQGTTAVGAENPLDAITFSATGPNPFTVSATLSYELPWSTHVRLQVYDAAGRMVATLVDGPEGAGSHSFMWDGRTDSGEVVAAGVYLVGLQVRGIETTRKVVFLQ